LIFAQTEIETIRTKKDGKKKNSSYSIPIPARPQCPSKSAGKRKRKEKHL